MTAEIIHMPKKAPEDEYILICGKCKCKSFSAMYKGGLECTNCETQVQVEDTDVWRKMIPALPANDDIPPIEGKAVTAHRFLDETFARRMVMNEINGYLDTDKICFVAGYNTDGFGRAWMDVRTEPQRAWVLDKLEELHEFTMAMDISAEAGFKTEPEGMSQMELKLDDEVPDTD